MIAHEYFANFSKVSNSDQTGSETIGTMALCLMTCVSLGDVPHECPYPCQRAILFLHR